MRKLRRRSSRLREPEESFFEELGGEEAGGSSGGDESDGGSSSVPVPPLRRTRSSTKSLPSDTPSARSLALRCLKEAKSKRRLSYGDEESAGGRKAARCAHSVHFLESVISRLHALDRGSYYCLRRSPPQA